MIITLKIPNQLKAAQIFLQTIERYQLYPSLILITKTSDVIVKL